jgi:hypothetical protein
MDEVGVEQRCWQSLSNSGFKTERTNKNKSESLQDFALPLLPPSTIQLPWQRACMAAEILGSLAHWSREACANVNILTEPKHFGNPNFIIFWNPGTAAK